MTNGRKQNSIAQLGSDLDRDLLAEDTPLSDIEADLVELAAMLMPSDSAARTWR